MKISHVLLCMSISCFFSAQAQEINAPKFGKGLFNVVGKDSTWSMKIGTRMQFLALSELDSDEDGLSHPASSFLIRRARLKFDGFAFSPKLQYKIELGLSNRDMSGGSQFTSNSPRYIFDAILKWNFAKNLYLWLGQAKLPGNRERVISSGDMQQVDRSLLNSRFNIDRDVGLQLRHHFNVTDKFLVREVFAFSQGEGRNVTTGNLGGYQYTSRIEFLPFGEFSGKGDYKGSDLQFEKSSKLSIGITYDLNNNAVKDRSNMGNYMVNDVGFYQTNISTLFIDAMYKYKGFSFMAEYANRNATDPIAKNSDGSLTGDVVQVGNAINFQTGYLLNKTLELSARYTNVQLDENITGSGTEDQYTFGVSKYIVGHKLKVQTDVSFLDNQMNTDKVMFRLQVDVHF